MRLKRLLFIRLALPLFCFLLFHPLSTHSLKAAAVQQEEPVQAELIAEENTIQPGRPFWVGVELKMADGWDTYWLNPGNSGFPTEVNWQLPEGFTADPLLWPYPQKFTNDSLVAFGYTDSVLLLAKITPPKELPMNETIDIGAEVKWLACKESCVPGGAHLFLALPVDATPPQLNHQTSPLFSAARQSLPQTLSQKEGSLTIQSQKEEIILHFKPRAGSFGKIDELTFIPEDELIDYAAPQNLQTDRETVTLNLKRSATAPQLAPKNVKGVLLVSEKGSTLKRAIQVDTPLTTSTPKGESGHVSSFGFAMGLAFLGGIILNIMPCVLPVIALKIFGFVKMAHQRRGVILQHGAVFSLGVVLSFWILSGILLILRAYGEGIGWGFQLQEPAFVAILAAILFLLGLSLFGVFEMGTSLISLGAKASKADSPLGNSFMSGILATLVATPCTGPLLGPALGFAMTLPAAKALTIFTAMGLGMAFPYFLFSLFPNLVRFLPKPGNWMIIFKQLMGFLMMATVVWLVWVFGAQTDHMALLVLLMSFVIIAVGAWIFGRWGTPLKSRFCRIVSVFLSAIIILGGISATVVTAKQRGDVLLSSSNGQLASQAGWELYSPERVEELRAQGIPVFVDFTAKWCLICQTNKMTLHAADTEKAFKEKGVVTMVADWTKKDPVISEELDRLGRTGVPVYVLYPPNPHQSPYILPQTLTGKVIHDYLNKLGSLDGVCNVNSH